MRPAAQVAEHLRSTAEGMGLSEPELIVGLEGLCHKGLMLAEEGQYLSLALPMNPNW